MSDRTAARGVIARTHKPVGIPMPAAPVELAVERATRPSATPYADACAAPEKACIETWSAALNLRALLAEHGSNVWVVSEAQLLANLNSWTRIAGAPERVLFPVKANPSPAVLELLAAAGASADCASPAEILLARLAGFPNARIAYNSPAADLSTAWKLLVAGGTVVADSREFLAALDEQATAAHEVGDAPALGQLFVRVNPAIDIRYRKCEAWSELTSHAKKTGKFGIPAEEVDEAVASLRTLRVAGLHAHVGTQMDHVEPFVQLAAHLSEIADAIADRTGVLPTLLDLGGGLGIPFTSTDEFPSIDALGNALATTLDPRFTYLFEPGHALVGNAVALLGSVVSVKSVRGKRWTIADVGTDQLAKITLLSWHHPVLGPDGHTLATTGNDALGGPLCFSGDTLLPATDTSHLQVGDPVLVQHAGAYCASLASTFNGRRSGGTVVLRANGAIERTTPRASGLDEPLARGHAWSALTATHETRMPLALDVIAPLSSKVLREDLCAERFAYIAATSEGTHAYEFEFAVSSPVGFVSMPLAIRLTGDAAIVSTLRMLGYATKAFPVWGTSLDLRMSKQISTNEPVRVRIELSHAAQREGPKSRRLAVRFTMRSDAVVGDAAAGSFEIMFDEAGAGC
jgi:diaminopimelate decarboxylase